MSNDQSIKGITIIGGEFFEADECGNFKNTIATIYPKFCLMVISRGGIHADQIFVAEDYLKKSLPETEEVFLLDNLLSGVVSLNLVGHKLVIRMKLPKIELALAADEMLQRLLPKNRIQFTGLHLSEVRNALRLRGEIWRMAPAPVEEDDYSNLICQCRIHVSTGSRYLYNRHTGEHVLTYEEFIKIRPLLQENMSEAISRLKEIVHLTSLLNNQGYPELVFLTPSGQELDVSILKDIISVIGTGTLPKNIEAAEASFDQFAMSFADQAGAELTIDDPKCGKWRATTLCRLYNIDEKTTAEWALGLGPEFYLNIRWLPGARITGKTIVYDEAVNHKVKNLINYYWQSHADIISINVGSIICPMTQRNRGSEEREVYIVSLGLQDGRKDIRHVRMSKWDVKHRLKKGLSLEHSIKETNGYRDYIIDRLTAARALGLPIPLFKEIDIQDESGTDTFPAYYFEREYIPGIVTSRIPYEFYSKKGFLPRLAGLLGEAAAASLVLGRTDPRTHALYFDDGDEVIQLNNAGLPERLKMIETTGSFGDWTTPLAQTLPHCLDHIQTHIQKAEDQGITVDAIREAVKTFADGLKSEIKRMQGVLNEPDSMVYFLFSDRTNEDKGVRNRWENILNRLKTTDANELKEIIENEFKNKYSKLA